jgi:hypothetical protein
MTRSTIARLVNPWKYRREQEEQRVAVLRQRDGDNCARCRRPMRFDLPVGHDMAARVEELAPSAAAAEPASLDTLVLTHGRCNAQAGDNTAEVTQRVRQKSEAALFEATRRKRRA